MGFAGRRETGGRFLYDLIHNIHVASYKKVERDRSFRQCLLVYHIPDIILGFGKDRKSASEEGAA
ncbi:MAG: hypothetical protein CMF66_00720 [Magnetovibrio sp.]|nr:hypothetical protein [Magnetovibrio sp.]